MPTNAFRSIRWTLAASLAGLLAACATPPETASDVLTRASAAMGAPQLKTLRYTGEGEGFTFGQAYLPNGPWPKVAYPSVTRTIDYDAAAMRDEVTLSRAEPRGGGGYPLSGPQRNDQFISGEFAWNVVGGNIAPGTRFVADRTHQLWITPHGVLKAAQRNSASVKRNADGSSAVSFTQPGRFSATATISAAGLVTQVDSTYPDPVLGDTAVVTQYSDYRDVTGIKFPGRVRQSAGGLPTLDLAIKDVQANVATAALALPDAARNVAERVTTDKVAEGVWFVAGGSHNSVAIEMADHMVLVETPLNDARTQAVIDAVKALAPGKPIRYAVNSHQHFDHSGGVRAAAAEGAIIVTQAANVPYFERVLAQPSTVRPDRLAQSGKTARLQGVGDKGTLADASRSIELHRIQGSVHTDSFLMVYLPKEKLLIQADAFTPAPPNTPPPAVANANHLNLIDNLERLKLNVERILPLHGRVVPLGDLYAAAGKAVPR
jgi:glyoxylase-like metal-dependent hydrolase (beta-lactamase superfamily II)